MTQGFYKRRRGILEHIESGAIDLLESGIHDYLLLKANLLIGSSCSIPPGVCFTSAPAIHAHCRRVSERTIQRCLEHLEAIGWIKTWKTPGKRGNYPVLVCRASVHDLSGNEYRVNGAKTANWRHPVYDPVGEVSGNCPEFVGSLSGNREKRTKEERAEEERISAAAYLAIGFEKPFGQPKFQNIWIRKFKERGEWLTATMEETIQECQQKNIGIPPQFYDSKRDVETRENAEFYKKYRRAPL
jgi:hypothetical protein